MNRTSSTAISRIAVAILAALFFAAFPQMSYAQTDPLIGTWKVNVAKSTFSPGPALRSATATVTASGQGSMAVLEGIDGAGKAIPRQVYTVIYDGQSHPVTGVPAYDANSIKRVDAYTFDYTRTKAGKVVQTGRSVFSIDGKTATFMTTGVDANGQQISNVVVFEKQ
ncbi:MAG TPA: hypothetical protein VEU06_11055 [Micropepsaceae bacterium]|nr:hypothetical protein [Micropepsaceae bacterium]